MAWPCELFERGLRRMGERRPLREASVLAIVSRTVIGGGLVWRGEVRCSGSNAVESRDIFPSSGRTSECLRLLVLPLRTLWRCSSDSSHACCGIFGGYAFDGRPQFAC